MPIEKRVALGHFLARAGQSNSQTTFPDLPQRLYAHFFFSNLTAELFQVSQAGAMQGCLYHTFIEVVTKMCRCIFFTFVRFILQMATFFH